VLAAAQLDVHWPLQAKVQQKSAFIDRRRILQLLTNLVDNARKFSRAGGRVTIDMDAGPSEAWFSVADTGPGIAAEDREQIFRPYYQRSAGYAQNGVGLGLAIVKGIVDCHGGRIELDSDIGKGCRFRVVIPAAASERSGTEMVV